MFWNLWAFCHHLTLLTEWSVGRSFEKNAAAWNPTGARDQNRKWWESTPSLAAAVGEYIYSNHLCPLIVLYAWELFFCYHFKRNSAAKKAVRKTEKTKKTVARKHTPIPKSATPLDQLSPTPLVGDVNEECVCGAGASDGFPDGWTEPESRDREVSSTFLGLNGRRVVSRAQLGQSAGAWRRAAFLLLRTFPVAPPCFGTFLGTGTCGEVKPGDVSGEQECEKINRRQPRRTYLVWYWNSLAAMAKHSRFVDSQLLAQFLRG